jgi:hypothetical protein
MPKESSFQLGEETCNLLCIREIRTKYKTSFGQGEIAERASYAFAFARADGSAVTTVTHRPCQEFRNQLINQEVNSHAAYFPED